MKKYNIAVIGATGNVGREILQTLSQREFPCDKVTAIGTDKSAGSEVSFGEDTVLTVQDIAKFDFKGTDIAFFAAGSEAAAKFAPIATKAGAVVIDTSMHFHMNPDVPLIVPEVNPEKITDHKKRNIIASPNANTIALAMALAPLHETSPIRRVVVATYQAVSDAGRVAMDELFTQTRAVFVNDALKKEHFRKQIAFNVIPHTSDFMEDGTTQEEWRIMVETKKIIAPAVKISATCVRVPVFVGHAMAVNIELENPISAGQARQALKKNPGITIIDHKHEEGFVTPIECAGDDPVFISRVREDISVENGINLWIVTDNLRKGSALNAVQIAELLVKKSI